MPRLRDFWRDHQEDPDRSRLCEMVFQLGGEDWRGAEREWRRLISTFLDDVAQHDKDKRFEGAVELAIERLVKSPPAA